MGVWVSFVWVMVFVVATSQLKFVLIFFLLLLPKKKNKKKARSVAHDVPKNIKPPGYDFEDLEFLKDLQHPKRSKKMKEFLEVMALCHTVVPIQDGDNVSYQASSPGFFFFHHRQTTHKYHLFSFFFFTQNLFFFFKQMKFHW